jgi:hypothetical protein
MRGKGATIRLSQDLPGTAADVVQAVRGIDDEGVIAKGLDVSAPPSIKAAPYQPLFGDMHASGSATPAVTENVPDPIEAQRLAGPEHLEHSARSRIRSRAQRRTPGPVGSNAHPP